MLYADTLSYLILSYLILSYGGKRIHTGGMEGGVPAPPPSYALMEEFVRLGVPDGSGRDDACQSWRLDTEANANFQLCSTYASLLAVPSSATAAQLASVAAFAIPLEGALAGA